MAPTAQSLIGIDQLLYRRRSAGIHSLAGATRRLAKKPSVNSSPISTTVPPAHRLVPDFAKPRASGASRNVRMIAIATAKQSPRTLQEKDERNERDNLTASGARGRSVIAPGETAIFSK
jgi:hypothetical protein